jgi:hypothetical protein
MVKSMADNQVHAGSLTAHSVTQHIERWQRFISLMILQFNQFSTINRLR